MLFEMRWKLHFLGEGSACGLHKRRPHYNPYFLNKGCQEKGDEINKRR